MPLPTPGPWQTPPGRQEHVLPGAANSGATRQYDAIVSAPFGTWADLLNPTVVYPLSADNEAHIEHLSDITGETWEVDQWILDLAQTPTKPSDWSPPLPWPARAVDWEFDWSANTNGVYALLTPAYDMRSKITVHLEDPFSDYTPDTPLHTMTVSPVGPATLVLDYGFSGQEARPQNVQRDQLILWPEVGTGDPAVGGTTSIVTDWIAVSDWFWCLNPVTGTEGSVRWTINWSNFRSGVEPAANTLRRMLFTGADLTWDWQPPRWRFLYDRPPRLRQFPRDDMLGNAPRPGRESTSVQATARQGSPGTYR